MNLGLNQLVFEFIDFQAFSSFDVHFSGVYLSSASRKAHNCDPHIFIFVLVPILWINCTCNLGEKPYVRWEKVCLLVLFSLFLKMLFKGEKGFRANWMNRRAPH